MAFGEGVIVLLTASGLSGMPYDEMFAAQTMTEAINFVTRADYQPAGFWALSRIISTGVLLGVYTAAPNIPPGNVSDISD